MIKQLSRILMVLLSMALLASTTAVAHAAPMSQTAVPVSLPDAQSAPSSQVTIPVTVGDTTGQEIIAYSFQIDFDPNVLSYAGFDINGTLSQGWSITPNGTIPGQIRIVAFSFGSLSGSGTLINLQFDVIGAANTSTALTWDNFSFNEGEPAATTTGGSVSVVSWVLAGQVFYQGGDMNMEGVTIDLNGATPNQILTDIEGYSFTIEDTGAYTVTPSFSGQVNGITAYDAAYIAQCVAEVRPATDCPEPAADTSGSDGVTAFDAALIAQYVVGLSNPNSLVGTWVFAPVQNSYASINSDLPNEDFAAYLVGEVTGNWSPNAQ